MGVILNGSELHLSGYVGGSADGGSFWDPPGFNASDVVQALAAVGRENPITVRINSGGGDAFEGSAIYAALAQHKGAVHVIVEGIAASAASVIAAAGDTVSINRGSVFMIHDPATIAVGTAADFDRVTRALNATADAYAGIYADKTGRDAAEMRALMVAESWMTPEQAVEAGFADEILDLADGEEDDLEVAAFAYGVYARAPERLVALANAKGWKARAAAGIVRAEVDPAAAPVSDEEADATVDDEFTDLDNLVSSSEDPVEAARRAAEAVAEVGTGESTGEPSAAVLEAPSASDAIEVAATLGAAGYTADKIRAFVSSGGDLARARARAEEIAAIAADLELARSANPAVTLTVAEAVRDDLSHDDVRAKLWPMVAAQAVIAPQAPTETVRQNAMARAMEKHNARISRR